jgi:uncharacterized protein YyaL (SSP411 family)
MADAYRDQRADVLENVASLAEGLGAYDAYHRRQQGAPDPAQLTASLVIAAGRAIVGRCDRTHGGLAGAPKFPNAPILSALRTAARYPHGAPAAAAASAWFRPMVERGLYDHLGGGWARYCVDATWTVPHFEKMLYDSAQLLRACADELGAGDIEPAWRARLGEVVAETVAFLDRELGDPAGGLRASLDADSEGREGAFYVWTPAQLQAALGPVGALQFAAAYGVTDGGNFEHGASVLTRVSQRGGASDEAALADLRARLLSARAARPRPATDTKVLAAWNGLAIGGLVAAWRATGHEPALALALRVGTFLRAHMIDEAGASVGRVWAEGALAHHGTLDDYAQVALAMLDLAEATGDAAWWRVGAALVATIRARFVGEAGGVAVFYLTAAGVDPLLVHRTESHQDGAAPSGASTALLAMARLASAADDDDQRAFVERYLAERLTAGADPGVALTSPGLIVALDELMAARVVVVSEGAGRQALVDAARGARAHLAGAWSAPSWHQGRGPSADGRAQAYVCQGTTCSLPVQDAAVLGALLADPTAARPAG